MISSLWKGRFFNVFLIFDSETIFILYAHKNFFETIFIIFCDCLWFMIYVNDYYVYINDYLWLCFIICGYYIKFMFILLWHVSIVCANVVAGLLFLFICDYWWLNDYYVYVNDYLWLFVNICDYLWLFVVIFIMIY